MCTEMPTVASTKAILGATLRRAGFDQQERAEALQDPDAAMLRPTCHPTPGVAISETLSTIVRIPQVRS
jgi:hypothetical protein